MTDSRVAVSRNDESIRVENLVKTYRGKRGRKVAALKGISFSVRQGEVFGFLGPNGSGKSTTIKTVMGLIRPTSGRVFLGGAEAGRYAARSRVGFLPENPSFYEFLSGREYLRFVGRFFDVDRSTARRIDEVLSLLSLTEAADRPLRGYSKGMVQRLGIAQALLHDPDIFILDEPMSGLDPLGRALVKDLILQLKAQGKTVFFSTHVTADIERVCDRVGVIVSGVFQGERVVSELLREGIEGYFCRVRGIKDDAISRFQSRNAGEGIREVIIPKKDFDSFAAFLLNQGGSFDLIEPHRRDLEDYFLSLVKKNGE